jgi:predicted tellurium resistance membrane protein TerC
VIIGDGDRGAAGAFAGEAWPVLARRIAETRPPVLLTGLLGTVAIIVQRTEPIVTVFGTGLFWRDLILIADGLLLVWKVAKEISSIIAVVGMTEPVAIMVVAVLVTLC